MKFTTTKVLAVAALAALPMIASAQLTTNISLTTNYKFRGEDQDVLKGGTTSKTSWAKPALQGGFDYSWASGFYVGNWNSTVNWLNGNSLEMDVYGGYKGDLGSGFTYDIGALTYLYPGVGSANTTEIYGGLGWGPLSAKYSHTVSKKYFGATDGRGTGYWNFGYGYEFAKGLTGKASIGYTDFDIPGATNYWDYSLGLAYDLGEGFSLGGAYVGATKKSFNTYASDPSKSLRDGKLIISITKAM